MKTKIIPNFAVVLYIFFALIFVSCSGGSSDNKDSSKSEQELLPKFLDVTHDRELFKLGFLGQTSGWGDYNNDGTLDLFVGNTDLRGTTVFLYANQNTKFVDTTEASKFANEPLRSSAWGDFNNDGYLDLIQGSIVAIAPPRLYKNSGGNSFENISESAGLVVKGSTIQHTLWADYNKDGLLDIMQIGSGPNFLYKNNGNETFSEVSESAGITGTQSSNSGVWIDINNDTNLDLLIANTGLIQLYLNNGDGTFTERTQSAGFVEGQGGGDSACGGDYDNDGFIDIFVGSKLYKNNGDITFTDVSVESLTSGGGDNRTCAFVDFDGDGYLDIFTTFHTSPSRLFRNLGNGKFDNVALELGFNMPVDVFTASWGDYNFDGFIDVFINGHLGRALMENQGNANNNIVINLVGNGTTTNTSAIGSRVVLTSQNNTQIREVSGGKGCCEQDMLPVHFGVGKETNVNFVISWTDGSKCEFNNFNVDSNAVVSIKQDSCELTNIKVN